MKKNRPGKDVKTKKVNRLTLKEICEICEKLKFRNDDSQYFKHLKERARIVYGFTIS